MEYSNKIDLISIFKDMPDYIILRISDAFPNYYTYTDVDILCGDMDGCKKYLHSILELSENKISDTQTHLDFFHDGKLDIKFDLYGRYISDKYSNEALRSRVQVKRGNNYFFISTKYLDGISKCYEYICGKEKYKEFGKYKKELDGYKI